jgi:hypothetical protein
VNHLHVPELRLEIGVSVDGGRHGAHEPVAHWVHALQYGAGPGQEHRDRLNWNSKAWTSYFNLSIFTPC